MSREWKPGDVAMVTAYNKSEPYRAYFDGKTWRECDGNAFCVDQPTSCRPLVVIDPEDREQVERVRQAIGGKRGCLAINRTDEMQAALRSLVADPKPEEPLALGAVVEDDKGRHWVRVFGGAAHVGLSDNEGPWKLDYAVTARRLWPNLSAIRVLSAGWSE